VQSKRQSGTSYKSIVAASIQVLFSSDLFQNSSPFLLSTDEEKNVNYIKATFGKSYPIPFSEKRKLYFICIKRFSSIFGGAFLFILISAFFLLVWHGSSGVGKYIIYVLCSILTGLPIFIIFYAVIPDIRSDYKEKVSRKYGVNHIGVAIDKGTEEISEPGSDEDSEPEIETLFYVNYEYKYQGTKYEGQVVLENQECYDAIEIGHEIPIRLLEFDPSESFPRRVKLARTLGFSKNICS